MSPNPANDTPGNENAAPSSAQVATDRISFFKLRTKAIFNRLERIAAELNNDKLQGMDEYALTALLDSLGELKSSFNDAHTSLEELDFDSICSDLPGKFDSNLINLRSTLQREIGKRSTSQLCSTFRVNANESQSIIVNANRSRLPLLTLPKFTGTYTEWTNFYSMFVSVIDKDSDITPVDKLLHLRSCLSGPALDTIRSLEINEANYENALDLLHKRFDNKRLIFQAHIREIFGLGKADGSVGRLRELTDKLTAQIRALESLGSKEQISDCIIVQLLIQKLDKATQAKWEENSPTNELPSCDQLSTFLEKRCRTLENVEHVMQAKVVQAVKTGKNVSTNQRKSFVASGGSVGVCEFCGSHEHLIYHCPRFVNLSPNFRQNEVKQLALCPNCLKKGHQMRNCKSGSCRNCQSKHHTLLHFDSSAPTATIAQGAASQSVIAQPNVMTAALSASSQVLTSPSDVGLLATAVILVKGRAGTFVPCRALLDSGSQLNFITSRFTNQLQLRKTKTLAAVSGIGGVNFSTEGYSVDLVLKSRTSDFSATITAVVAQTLTDSQPGLAVNTVDWKIASNIQLADPNFNIPQRIDLLIGAGLFFDLLCVGQIQLASGLPLLQKTRFGWVLSGGGQQTPKLTSFVVLQRSFTDIDFKIAKTTKEELDCEEHFRQNYSRLSSGDYSVRLPVKTSLESLGDSYSQALHRLRTLERKLFRKPQLKEKYVAFINEYLDLNHMSLVSSKDIPDCKFFLPQHCVIKEDSTTTKLRVVFDGSTATTLGLSLNDLLMVGPTIQPKLFNILIRFRSFPVALTGDICKIYRCVRVTAPDDMLQCILWRDSPQDALLVYRLNTVIYGTKPASFLAIRAMHQLSFDESSAYPLGSQVVLQDFYVDHMISGGNSVEEVRNIMQQTTSLFRGNFQLRKWCSNSPDVLGDIPQTERGLLKFDDGSDITKALGLIWDPFKYNLLFSFSPQPKSSRNTKRSVLATVARSYDPLGLLGPTLTRAKILLQRMWRDKLEWDESLPHSLDTAWSAFCEDFVNIQHSSFPRYVLQPGAALEIHAFCDASLEAYGACIYARSTKNDNVQVNLLCSKARVAPLKTLTVPKLELSAAALLAQLVGEIAKMNVFDCRFYCWSDSSIVLSWLQEESSKFNVFVANRICAIQELIEYVLYKGDDLALYSYSHEPSRHPIQRSRTKRALDINSLDAWSNFLARSENQLA